MPYTVIEQDSQFCVVKEGDNDPRKCYDNRAEAMDYLQALASNVEDSTSEKSIYFGGAIKAYGDTGIIEGMLITFTDANQRDLTGEYFDKSTDLHIPDYDPNGLRVLYHHGLDETLGVKTIGKVIKAKIDDVGVWIQAQLDLRDKYEKAVYELARSGKLGWSSGALPQSVRVNRKDGHIDSWAMIEASATPLEAMPFTNKVTSAKALNPVILLQDEPVVVGRRGSNESEGVKSGVFDKSKEPLPTKGTPKMDKIKAALRDLLDLMDGVDETVASEAETHAQKALNAIPEETQKSLSETEILDLVSKAIEAAQDSQRERQSALKAKAAQLEARDKKKTPPLETDYLPAANKSLDGAKSARITNVEMLEFSGMSADEMLLGIKMAFSSVNPTDRKSWKLKDFSDRGILSEEYLKTALHKTSASVAAWDAPSHTDLAAMNDFMGVKSMTWLKADELLATDITNQGAELVEYLYDTQLWRRVRDRTELFNRLANKGMRVMDIPLGRKGMNVKYDTTGATVYTLNEANSTDVTNQPEAVVNWSQLSTNEVEVPLGTHIIAEGVTFQLEQRSIINIVSEVQFDMIMALSESLESALINADTATAANTNINKIDGTPVTGIQKPDYLIWNGLRKAALAQATTYLDNASGALDAVDYETVRALFPLKFRTRKNEILFIIDAGIEKATRKLAEHFTTGVAGERATFFTGDVSVLVGYDVYASGFLALSNINGKISVTPGNNTQGQILGVYAPYCQYGRQLRVNVEQQRLPMSQTTVFVATVNHGFAVRSEYAAVMMYDINV